MVKFFFKIWLFKNALQVKMDENGLISQIDHSCDVEILFQVVNIDELINKSSS